MKGVAIVVGITQGIGWIIDNIPQVSADGTGGSQVPADLGDPNVRGSFPEGSVSVGDDGSVSINMTVENKGFPDDVFDRVVNEIESNVTDSDLNIDTNLTVVEVGGDVRLYPRFGLGRNQGLQASPLRGAVWIYIIEVMGRYRNLRLMSFFMVSWVVAIGAERAYAATIQIIELPQMMSVVLEILIGN